MTYNDAMILSYEIFGKDSRPRARPLLLISDQP